MTRRTLLALAWLCLAAAAHAQTAQQLLLGGPGITVPQGLVARYLAGPNAGVSGTTAANLAPTTLGTNNGTLVNGPTVVAAQVGQGVSFNGSTQTIDLGNTLPALTSMSWSFWYKRATSGAGNFIISKGTFGTDYQYGIYYDTSTPGWRVFGASNTSAVFASSTEGTDTSLHKLLVTKNGTTWSLARDSVPISSVTLTAGTASVNAIIAGLQGTSSFRWAGLVNDMREYNRVIAASEDQQIYAAGLNGRP